MPRARPLPRWLRPLQSAARGRALSPAHAHWRRMQGDPIWQDDPWKGAQGMGVDVEAHRKAAADASALALVAPGGRSSSSGNAAPAASGRPGSESRSPRRAGGTQQGSGTLPADPKGRKDFVRHQELGAILEGMGSDLLEKVKAITAQSTEQSLAKLGDAFQTSTADAIKAASESYERRLAEQSRATRELAARITASEEDSQNLWRHVDRLEKAVALAEKTVPREYLHDLSMWDRPPDQTILLVNGPEEMSLAAVEQALQELWAHLELPPQAWKVEGETTDTRFTVQFNGSQGLAAARAKAAHNSLRGKRGWKDTQARTTLGQMQRIYVAADESPATTRKKVHTKKALQVLERAYPGKSFTANRWRGEVLLDKKPLLRLEVAPQETHLKWNPEVLLPSGIDKSRFKQDFDALWADASPVQWEV